jgi:hypothetical protein
MSLIFSGGAVGDAAPPSSDFHLPRPSPVDGSLLFILFYYIK